jgi:repressor LexA
MQAIYTAEPRVPLYRAKFPAGAMGSVLDQEVADEYFSLAGKNKPRFAVPVRGRSMEPDFRDGDLIIIERTSQVRDGDFVLTVCDEDEEGTFKKYVKKKDGYVLQPLNQDYKEIPLTEKHRIVGKVLWLVRKV